MPHLFATLPLTGELDAGSLDVSGDADIDGTLETDALSINGTTVTSTAAELNILDGVTSTAAELNYLDITTLGTSEASKAVTVDASGDLLVPDSDKFKFGAGSDMQVYHDGTDSYVTNATGELKLATESSGIAIAIGHSTSEVTFGDNVTITGDLAVNGTTTTINTTNLTVTDPLVKFGQAYTGSAYDEGFIVTRGDGSSSNTANKGLIWDESADEFAAIACNTEDGTTAGNVTINSYADLQVGKLTGASLDISGDVDVDGTLEADAMTLNGTSITATATLSTGISNTNVPVFTSGVADDDFLRVAGTSIEGRSAAEVLSDIGASAVAGSGSIVTTGALDSGSLLLVKFWHYK
jgi:cytoskeletal protein CcmA (bactofilin family)